MNNLAKINLLIVDDEEALRESIVFDFKRKGFNVFSAENGNKAFEIVKENKIDLVISDMRMPGGDGLSLLEKIRSYNPEIPTVIFITGFSDVTQEECLAKGAGKVLSKPFSRKELIDSVFESLGLSIPGK